MMRADVCQAIWRGLPMAGLDEIIGDGTCLVLAPHPDDESLGCGGLIAACCAAARMPLVAILTDGGASHPQSREWPPERMRLIRRREAHQAVGHLGVRPERLVFCGFSDTRAPKAGPRFEAAVGMVCGLVAREPHCTAIVAPWRHDPHADHEAASFIAAEVAARSDIRHIAYPVWGWLLSGDAPIPVNDVTGWRLDVSPFLPLKRRAIAAHKSQYGGMVTDDPSGFQLPSELLAIFHTPYETYLPA